MTRAAGRHGGRPLQIRTSLLVGTALRGGPPSLALALRARFGERRRRGLDELLEPLHVVADLLLLRLAEEPGQERADLAGRRVVLQFYPDLGPAAGQFAEVDRPGGVHVGPVERL